MSLRYSTSGHSGRISLGLTPSSILSPSEFTVVTWVASEAPSGWTLALSSIANVSVGWRHWIGFDRGTCYFERNYTSSLCSVNGTVPFDGRWQFIAGVDHGIGNAPFLYQGEEDSAVADISNSKSTPAGSVITSSSPQLALMNNPHASWGLRGRVAFTAYFNAALTRQELEAIQFNPLAASLARSDIVALYVPGMHGTGNVYDLSGNGVDSTGVTGSPTLDDMPAVNWGFPDLGNDIVFSAASVSAQTITGSDLVDGDAFGSGTVSAGPAAITGTLFSDGDSFGAGTATPGAVNVSGAGHTDADSFGAGTVAPGAVTLTGGLYVDPDSFFGGVVSAGAVTIAGAGHADPDSFGSGVVSQGGAPAQNITGSALSDADSFGAGAVSLGAVIIAGTIHADADSFGSGSINTGSVTLTGTVFVDPDTIGSGIVSQGGPPPQIIGGTSYADADVFGAGTVQPGPVSIGGGQHVDIDTFGAGLVSAGGIQISGLRFVDADGFGSGAVQSGPVVLAGTLFVDPDVFGSGQLSGSAIPVGITPPERTLIIAAHSRVLVIPAEDRTVRA